LALVLFTHFAGAVVSSLAERAVTRALAMRSRIVSPPEDLRKTLDPVDLVPFNPSWNYHLVSFPIFDEHN
jgi:hypothetical protein